MSASHQAASVSGDLLAAWIPEDQLSDTITVTPALFVLSRPLGANTPSGESFQQLGGLVKTSFSF